MTWGLVMRFQIQQQKQDPKIPASVKDTVRRRNIQAAEWEEISLKPHLIKDSDPEYTYNF